MKLIITHTTLCLFFFSTALLIGSSKPKDVKQHIEVYLFDNDDNITDKIVGINKKIPKTGTSTTINALSAESLPFNKVIHEYTKELCKSEQPHTACTRTIAPEFCSYINGAMLQK